MATTLSLTETYVGKMAGEVIFAAQNALDSLKYLTVKPNVEYATKVRKLVDTASFADSTCDFTPTGTTTLTERTLTLKDLQIHRQYCAKDFLADWSAAYAQDGELDPTIQNGIADNLLAQANAILETKIWQGLTGAGSFKGFIDLMLEDSDVLDVGSAVALTSSNIIAKIDATIAAMPSRVKGQTEKPALYINFKTWELFMQAQIAAGNGWYANLGPAMQGMKYMGLYDINVCPGLFDDTIVFAQKSNLWFGTWKEAQLNELSVLSMKDKTLDDTIRMALRFYAGVQYGLGNEIALYTTATDS